MQQPDLFVSGQPLVEMGIGRSRTEKYYTTQLRKYPIVVSACSKQTQPDGHAAAAKIPSV